MKEGVLLENNQCFLEAKDILKIYGPTIAVNHLDIKINKGEVLALVGGNGAGKSTITKILSGVINCDNGTIFIDGEEIDVNKYTPSDARKKGIFVVHQELSLCKNLTVYENFYVEQYQQFGKGFNWRKQAKELAKKALDEVFPKNTIDVNAGLSTLSIAQQQMVEISRAMITPDLKMIVLDEPTSSLPAEETSQLQEYIKKTAAKGIAFIYISHRLKEVMYLADRVFIMQNGAKKHECTICETDELDMVNRMGSGIGSIDTQKAVKETPKANENVGVKFSDYSLGMLKNVTAQMHGGEIVCLTGLEGNGQLEMLHEIFYKAGKRKSGLEITGRVAYVAGDRKKEGNFPLWSIKDNTIISNIANNPLFKPLNTKNVTEIVETWNHRLKTKCNNTDESITSLSGGNQQKVLIARAMAVDADIILLDDPTRGVDIETKLELYEVFREAAKNGKLVVWRTSDDAELEYCTKLFVMTKGTVGAEYEHGKYEHSDILKVAFENQEKKDIENLVEKKMKQPKLYLFALITTIILYGICGYLSPMVLTKRGVELLAVGYAPFIFCALAQTFIIGLGHIDLSVGAFMGLVNVVTATILDQNTGFGIVALIILLIAYSLMGLFIYWRNVPPIIVTLGMSFVWTGIAYNLQAMPGGHVPEWMVTLFNFKNPVLKGVLIWLIICVIVSVIIYRSKYGTVLRGFGNNDNAMINSGWSKAKAFFMIYFIAGCFAMMGGFAQSGITGASDVNASSTYTMLTVAAVIIGGGYFSGGVVTHVGAVCGAISLTMVSILLGLLRVNTDFTATVQGLVLIVILSIRLIKKGVKNNE
ncbi:MAG: ATP-binding cassette domain-containing protein [Lachnospiraceae bacterium]|nr:ATP-binding cassette domain-containing protein [Lachnospiraceae bacterium]